MKVYDQLTVRPPYSGFKILQFVRQFANEIVSAFGLRGEAAQLSYASLAAASAP